VPWQKLWGGSGVDVPIAAVADAAGDVYVAGYSWDTNATDSRAFIQRRSPGGALR
jgi:hypothetical protein